MPKPIRLAWLPGARCSSNNAPPPNSSRRRCFRCWRVHVREDAAVVAVEHVRRCAATGEPRVEGPAFGESRTKALRVVGELHRVRRRRRGRRSPCRELTQWHERCAGVETHRSPQRASSALARCAASSGTVSTSTSASSTRTRSRRGCERSRAADAFREFRVTPSTMTYGPGASSALATLMAPAAPRQPPARIALAVHVTSLKSQIFRARVPAMQHARLSETIFHHRGDVTTRAIEGVVHRWRDFQRLASAATGLSCHHLLHGNARHRRLSLTTEPSPGQGPHVR